MNFTQHFSLDHNPFSYRKSVASFTLATYGKWYFSGKYFYLLLDWLCSSDRNVVGNPKVTQCLGFGSIVSYMPIFQFGSGLLISSLLITTAGKRLLPIAVLIAVLLLVQEAYFLVSTQNLLKSK